MKTNWKQISEIIVLLSVVVSLLFVGYELRMNRQVAVNDTFGSAASVTPDVIDLIISRPSVWERGCAGEELNREDEVIFGGLVQAVDRHFFYRYRRIRDGITSGDPIRPASRVARNRALFPGFDRKWQELYRTGGAGEDEGGEYGDIIRAQYEILKQSLEKSPVDSTLCGLYGL